MPILAFNGTFVRPLDSGSGRAALLLSDTSRLGVAGSHSGRYIQRMESFDALLEFAREKGIYGTDKEIIDYIYIKKATLGAIRNRRSAKRKILAHTGDQIPNWRKNALYRSDWRLRLALLVL